MISYNINEKHIKKDSWVKDVNKTYNPELLADLIKKRLEYPGSTGPFIRYNSDELPSDIIDAFIADSDEARKKLEPAIGLLLYKMMHGKMHDNHEILRCLFSIIRTSKLTECRTLVANWLHNKYADGSIDGKWKHTYRDGMMAYAQIQDKNTATEEWWVNIWNGSGSMWWPAAFLGLRIQNPAAACKELPTLISRNIDKTSYLLLGMWSDMNSRSLLEVALRNGLDENNGWAGLALNMILEKLSDADKNKIMSNLKKLIVKEVKPQTFSEVSAE